MRGQVKHIAAEAKETGKINFGGEYSFKTTDDYETALDKLYKTGCEIGGTVKGNGYVIKVYPAYDPGYWSFEWTKFAKGVRYVSYCVCESVTDAEWNEAKVER